MKRPKLLDLFCCQGGAAAGYVDAGFDVVGVDIDAQSRYPYAFHQGDAMTWPLDGFDAVLASPPCQLYSNAQRIQNRVHPDFVELIRERLQAWGGPYVIENVRGAPLLDPVELCGTMFGLHTYRHRLFESNVSTWAPLHFPHTARTIKMGRAVADGEFYHAVGNFSNVAYARRDMGVAWMNRDGIRECIPPAYTRLAGQWLRAAL